MSRKDYIFLSINIFLFLMVLGLATDTENKINQEKATVKSILKEDNMTLNYTNTSMVEAIRYGTKCTSYDFEEAMINVSKHTYIAENTKGETTFDCTQFSNLLTKKLRDLGYDAYTIAGYSPDCNEKNNCKHNWVKLILWIEPQDALIVKREDGYKNTG